MFLLSLYISIIWICFGFRYSVFEFMLLDIITYFQIHSFMQNKANFKTIIIDVNFFMKRQYEISSRLPGPKNKPNSNPIQSQFNPIQTQFKPIQTQFKANCAKYGRTSFVAKIGKPLYHYQNYKNKNFSKLGVSSNDQNY